MKAVARSFFIPIPSRLVSNLKTDRRRKRNKLRCGVGRQIAQDESTRFGTHFDVTHTMAYRRKDPVAKRLVGFIAVAALLAAAALMLRGRSEDDPEDRVPVYGTVTDTSLIVVDEEVGVFEEGAGDMTTMPPVSAESAATSPAAARVERPTVRPAAARAPTAVRQRATASIPRYERALAQKRSDPLLLNNYAWSLHQAGRYSEAEASLREVIRIAPNRAIAYANLGESLWKQGKNEEAAAMYRKFLELNTDPRRERIAQGKVAAITGGNQ
jgi:hypothetical protein